MKKDKTRAKITPLQSLLENLDLKAIAKESQWSQRRGGKLTPMTLCLALMHASSIATASLGIVAFLSERIGSISITPQALKKRASAKTVSFLEMALGLALSFRCRRGGNSRKSKFGFNGIIVADSATITLPGHLIDVFKGGKNAYCEKAGMKIDAAFDLVNKRILRFDIHESSKADQGFSLEGANEFGKGDLLIRDKGYFSLPAFREAIANGCLLISLYHLGTTLVRPKTLGEIDLPTLFRRRRCIDTEVLAGKKERLPMRMIAFKLLSLMEALDCIG